MGEPTFDLYYSEGLVLGAQPGADATRERPFGIIEVK